MALYLVSSGAMPTTASFVTVATGTNIKTLMQIKPGSTQTIRVIEWGLSFDGSASATPGVCELCVTGTVFGTGATAYVANDFSKLDGDALAAGDPTTAMFAVGTSASGFTPTAEGTITAVRYIDGPQLIAPTSQFSKQIPLGQEGLIQPGECLRIRVKFGATVNCIGWMKLQA